MQELKDFRPLKPAEQKLVECCQRGQEAIVAEERPTEKTEANEIRAEFLRWLILFAKIEIDPNGIQVKGAWISGRLDLRYTYCSSILSFKDSFFEDIVYLLRASTKSIYADGSLFLKGIQADGLICQGNLHLRNGFEAKEEVRLIGAQIEGSLNCRNGKFKALSAKESALQCDTINIGQDVSISDGFYAEGEVRFLGAKIEGNFDCDNGAFKALNGQECALNCNGMNIKGGLLLRIGYVFHGGMDLTHVTVGALSYHKSFWEQKTLKAVKLDGLKYAHIYNVDNDSDIKASFLLKNILGKMPEFKPQPYKQLAKVLRDMGHSREADEIMIALNDKRFSTKKEEVKKTKVCNFLSWLYLKLKVVWIPIKGFFFHNLNVCGVKTSQILWLLYKWTSEYGYRPMRTLKIMASVWFLFGCIYWYGANVAVFAPTNPLIFQYKDYNCTINKNGTKWLASSKDYNESNNWYIASPAEYTTFQPFWYSLDIILPVVDLKMENDWGIVIPSPEGSWKDMIPFTTTNHFIRFLTWVESLIGWGLSLMLAAILSGLAKNEKE